MTRTKTATLTLTLTLLVVGAVAAQGIVPGATAQQSQVAGNAGFAVDSLTAPDSAAPNSNVSVVATVSNDGDEAATEAVEFRVEGDVVDRTYVTLQSGETTTVPFSVDTDGLAPGDYRHGVFTATDGQIATLTLSESFTVDSLDAPTSATAGDDVTVTAEVSNPGDISTSQDVTFRFDGALVATETVTLDGNESTEVEFNVSTEGVESGTYVHSVLTRDAGTFADIAVTAPPEPPTEEPTENETESPETEEPTENETDAPETEEPTENETESPETEEPTEEVTDAPETEEPTENETDAPETEEPTENETDAPETEEPTEEATEAPETEEPTEEETETEEPATEEPATDAPTNDTEASLSP